MYKYNYVHHRYMYISNIEIRTTINVSLKEFLNRKLLLRIYNARVYNIRSNIGQNYYYVILIFIHKWIRWNTSHLFRKNSFNYLLIGNRIDGWKQNICKWKLINN